MDATLRNRAYRAFNEAKDAPIAAVIAECARAFAQTARDFGWTLPVYRRGDLNEVSDDAACSVCEQLAAEIERLGGIASAIEAPSGDETHSGSAGGESAAPRSGETL